MAGPNGPPAPGSRIVLEFPPDQVNCVIHTEGVTPAHIYLGAWLLEALAREVRARTQEGQGTGLVVARSTIPSGPSGR